MSIAMQLRRAPRLECLETRHALDAALAPALPALLPLPAPPALQAPDPADLPPPSPPSPPVVPSNASGPTPSANGLGVSPSPSPPPPLEVADAVPPGGASSKSSWDAPDPAKDTPTPKAPEKSAPQGAEPLTASVSAKLTKMLLPGSNRPGPEAAALEPGTAPLPGRLPRSTPASAPGLSGGAAAPGRPQPPVSGTSDRQLGPVGGRPLAGILAGRAPLGPPNLRGLTAAFRAPPEDASGAAALPPMAAYAGAAWLPGYLADALSWEALDQFFSSAEGVPPEARPALPGRLPNPSQPEAEVASSSLPPLYLGAYVPSVGKPVDPVAAGYQYLCNYARQSIRAAERQAGPLHDHDDIVQQICLEWLERAGPPDQAFPRLWEKAPAEMQLLRQTVHRVLARVAYQQRRGPGQVELSGWPAPDRPAERAWLEFQSDCERGVGGLTRPEWQILELRRQGYTFAEIGAAVGVPRQRVWEVYHEVVTRLQHIYGRAGGGDERS